MKCPNCSWHDSFHQIPEERNNMKEGFLRCHDCGAVTHKNAKTLETTFYSRSKEENEKLYLVHVCLFFSGGGGGGVGERLLVACFN